jgi:hypothetical protein
MTIEESQRTTQFVQKALRVLEQEGPMTLLQLFWRLVSAGEIHNDVENYDRFRQIMTRLREDGRCRSRLIVDRAAVTIDDDHVGGAL